MITKASLAELLLHGLLSTKAEVQMELQPYMSFIDKIIIIDGIGMKDKSINSVKISAIQYTKTAAPISHEHSEDMVAGMWVYMYLVIMNADMEEMKSCPTSLDFQAMWPKEKTMSQEIPGRPWKIYRSWHLYH